MLPFRRTFFKRASVPAVSRFFGTSKVTEAEILSILKATFPAAKAIKVQDTSGGVGAMFNIVVEAPEFKGLSIKNQHSSVYNALRDQIKNMHGLHVETRAVWEVGDD